MFVIQRKDERFGNRKYKHNQVDFRLADTFRGDSHPGFGGICVPGWLGYD